MKPPDWANSFGQDKYGYWANLRIKEQEQCFRWIEAGEFMMGFSEDMCIVRLTEGYWLAETVCSEEFWLAVIGNPSYFEDSKLPVDKVSWFDAKDFIKQLNVLLKVESFDLPTEAQWEYACRAGTTTAYAYGDSANSELMSFEHNRAGLIEVKSLYRNTWGLYQMHGKVWEWCNDYYGENDLLEEIVDPKGPVEGSYRVLRGGAWNENAEVCCSGFCSAFDPSARCSDFGFRLFARNDAKVKQ